MEIDSLQGTLPGWLARPGDGLQTMPLKRSLWCLDHGKIENLAVLADFGIRSAGGGGLGWWFETRRV